MLSVCLMYAATNGYRLEIIIREGTPVGSEVRALFADRELGSAVTVSGERRCRGF